MAQRITYAEAGAGKRLVVFLHGIGLDGESFRSQLDAVAALGWHGIGWNMPGYRGSEPMPGMGIGDCAAALAGLLDELGAPKAVVVGHSLGGFVALDFAVRHAERLAGLVLIGTTPSFGSKDGSFEREFLRVRFAPLDAGKSMADIAPGVAAGIIAGDAPNGLRNRIAATFAAIPEESYRTSITSMLGFDRRADLPAIAVPTLLIAGERDANAPLRTMQRMAEAIPGARLTVVEAVGHCPHLERAETVNRELAAFLAGLDAV
jgi:pimeloyl-ACP methyl ester carboxylesterase